MQLSIAACLQATFTPGKYTMQLSAKAYESWKFKEQGLPHDLVARCADGITTCSEHVRGQEIMPRGRSCRIVFGLRALGLRLQLDGYGFLIVAN